MPEKYSYLESFSKNLVFVSIKYTSNILSIDDKMEFNKKYIEEQNPETFFKVNCEYFYFLLFEAHNCLLNVLGEKRSLEEFANIWSFSISYMFQSYNYIITGIKNEESFSAKLLTEYKHRTISYSGIEAKNENSLLSNPIYVLGENIGIAAKKGRSASFNYSATLQVPNALNDIKLKGLVAYCQK